MTRRINRRRFVCHTGFLTGLGLAGCLGNGSPDGRDDSSRENQEARRNDEISSEAKEGEKPDIPSENIIWIDPDGSDNNPGSENEPLQTIQEGLRRAQPGNVVYALDGIYKRESYAPGEPPRTIRDGKPGEPITITGSELAVVEPFPSGPALRIMHSHIHLTGLTFDGLIDPEHPDEVSSYIEGTLISCRPPADRDEYLEDVVCAPAAVGNASRSLMVFNRTRNLEIGPVKIIGMAGAEWIIPQEPDQHAGEIIYLGSPPMAYQPDHEYPWSDIDQPHNVHIHHINNSEGHPHSQLVDAKIGSYDVLIECCTDGGGSQNTEPFPASSIRLETHNATVRWCDLQNGQGDAIRITGMSTGLIDALQDPAREDVGIEEVPAIAPEDVATAHEIYGNRVDGYGNRPLVFEEITLFEQDEICGNSFSQIYESRHHEQGERLEIEADRSCPKDLPEREGIGHDAEVTC